VNETRWDESTFVANLRNAREAVSWEAPLSLVDQRWETLASSRDFGEASGFTRNGLFDDGNVESGVRSAVERL
jgi:hypothetical protein